MVLELNLGVVNTSLTFGCPGITFYRHFHNGPVGAISTNTSTATTPSTYNAATSAA
jgi:hypothetical protein